MLTIVLYQIISTLCGREEDLIDLHVNIGNDADDSGKDSKGNQEHGHVKIKFVGWNFVGKVFDNIFIVGLLLHILQKGSGIQGASRRDGGPNGKEPKIPPPWSHAGWQLW